MRQYIITGMNGSHGYSQEQYGPWCQSIQLGYPYHSIWHPSHLRSRYYSAAPLQRGF